MNVSNNMDMPLFREDYNPEIKSYPIQAPLIKSGAEYYFETESGLRYQVMFAKKKQNYLQNIVNFSVLSEDFEDEYSETNRGEIYKVMATVVEIIRQYHGNHAYSTSYEFSGEFKKGNESRGASIRTVLYYRKAKEILDTGWEIEVTGNRVTVHRKKGRKIR